MTGSRGGYPLVVAGNRKRARLVSLVFAPLLVVTGTFLGVTTGSRAVLADTPLSTYEAAVLADSPISYWPLTDPAGSTTAGDLMGLTTGEVQGGVTAAGSPGPIAGTTAFSFDGGNCSGINLDTGASSLAPTQAVSVEAWAQSSSGSDGLLFRHRTFGFQLEPSDVGLYTNGGANNYGANSSANTTADGLWHYIVGTYDGSTLSLYVDGLLVASAAATGAVYYGDQEAAIGRDADACDGVVPSFQGNIAQVAVYGHALTATQIAAHFAAAAGGITAPLIILTTSLPEGTVGVSYDAQLEAAGGTPPVTWSVLEGRLPPGLTLDSTTGEITGVPTGNGGSAFQVEVTDASTPPLEATAVLGIAIGFPGPPTDVTVVPENGYAMVDWQPPTNQVGSSITGYVIDAFPYAASDTTIYGLGASAQEVSQPVAGTGSGPQSGVITHLIEDCHEEYTIGVAAVNAVGTGPLTFGAYADPSLPSPPNNSVLGASNPAHFRTSGIVAQSDVAPPVVVVTVDGFGSSYFLDSSGNPETSTIDPLIGVSPLGTQQVSASGDGLPISYCAEGEQNDPAAGDGPTANSSVPASIWATDYHFDHPDLDPGYLTSGGYVPTHDYLLSL